MINLKNSKGIIFGATGFIGRQVALEMSKRKVKLILHGRTKKKLEKLYDEIQNQYNIKQILLPGDFIKKNFFDTLSYLVSSRFSELDFLMHFAGKFQRLSPLTHFSHSEWDAMVEININSYWRVLKELEPLLKKSRKPKVLFTINENSSDGLPYQNIFSLSSATKKNLGSIFFKENKKLKIEMIIVNIPFLNNGQTSIIKSKKKEFRDDIARRIIEKAFKDKKNEKAIINL
jgi:short-subunit dehydrogenase